jgi:hypothetical protein
MAGATLNPLLAALSPDQQQTYAQLQQRQAIGQALLQQGLQPMDAGQNAVGGIAYHVSPLNGVSKLLNAYLGNKIAMDAAGQQAQLTSQMFGNAFGSNQPQASVSADPSQAPDAGGVAGGGSGAGVQTYPVANPFQPSAQQIGQQMTGAQSVGRAGPLTIPGYTPQESMQLYATLGPDGFTKLLAARTAPTAATLAAQQGGFDAAGANRAAFAHDTYTAPVQGSPGTIARNPYTGQPMYYSPDIPKGGEPLFNASGQVVGVKALDGSLQLISQAAAAQAGGEGSQLPYAGVDAQGNPLPVSNRTKVANQSTDQPPPIPTLPGLGGPGAASAGGPSVPLPAGAAPGGPIYAAPPLGAPTAADASQGAPSKQMADAQGALADSDNTYQASRQALQKMISITQNGGIGDVAARMLPEGIATRISSDAADYQKAHANFISLQGKALGAGATDTSRANLNDSVPTFDKPADAKLSGLNDQLNQLDWNHLKRQTLNPLYLQGNEKAYAQQSAAFDSSVQPSMMPQLNQYLAMPAGPMRTQALQQAIQNPQMKAALDLMVQTGQLK